MHSKNVDMCAIGVQVYGLRRMIVAGGSLGVTAVASTTGMHFFSHSVIVADDWQACNTPLL
jgi:hypothetical protein